MEEAEFVALLDKLTRHHRLVKGKKYKLVTGEEVVFEAVMPDRPPVSAAVSIGDDLFTVLLEDIIYD